MEGNKDIESNKGMKGNKSIDYLKIKTIGVNFDKIIYRADDINAAMSFIDSQIDRRDPSTRVSYRRFEHVISKDGVDNEFLSIYINNENKYIIKSHIIIDVSTIEHYLSFLYYVQKAISPELFNSMNISPNCYNNVCMATNNDPAFKVTQILLHESYYARYYCSPFCPCIMTWVIRYNSLTWVVQYDMSLIDIKTLDRIANPNYAYRPYFLY